MSQKRTVYIGLWNDRKEIVREAGVHKVGFAENLDGDWANETPVTFGTCKNLEWGTVEEAVVVESPEATEPILHIKLDRPAGQQLTPAYMLGATLVIGAGDLVIREEDGCRCCHQGQPCECCPLHADQDSEEVAQAKRLIENLLDETRAGGIIDETWVEAENFINNPPKGGA